MVFAEIVLLLVFGFFLLYLALLSLLALIARKHSSMESSYLRRVAVVIPAHDEELTITRALRSLLAVDYPQDHFKVIVIADNCTDRTAEISRSMGAIVYERKNLSLRGKGYALRWCFDRLLTGQTAYDAIVVVNANTEVSRNFLNVMNFYLEKGAQAIQCSDMVKPQPGAWSAEVTRVSFTLYNYVRPLGRHVIRCSAGLHGNGMCFDIDILRRVPWQAYSLSEDLEYGLMLLLHGITVAFAPEATVFAQMPQSPGNAESQRARWEAGRFPVVRKYVGLLFTAAIRRMSFKILDASVDLITPPLVNLLVMVAALLSVNLLLWGLGVEGAAQFAFLWSMLLVPGAIHVFVGLYAAGADRSLYVALLSLPRYALWKLLLYLKLLKGRQTENWIRTTREHSAS